MSRPRAARVLALALVLAGPSVAGCGGGTPAPAEPTVEDRFKTPEDWAKVFDDPARDAWQRPDEVVRLLGVAPGMTVADVGAGTGYFTRTLSRAVGPTGRVIATDIDPAMVRYLGRRAEREALTNVTPTQTTADSPGLPSGVDRVLIVDTWHHVGDRAAFARALAAALAPGAVVAVVDWTKDTARDPARHLRLEPAAVVADFAAAGFEARVTDETLPDNFVVLATRK